MSRSRHYVPRYRDLFDFRAKNVAIALRRDLPAALSEYEHHARWSTAPEFCTRLDYSDREAILLAEDDAQTVHHRGRRRGALERGPRHVERAVRSNNKGGRLEPADPRVVLNPNRLVPWDETIKFTVTI